METYEMSHKDFLSERFKKQIIDMMQESEEVNFPHKVIPEDFGQKEYERLESYYLKGMANAVLLLHEGNILSYVWYFIKDNKIHINEIATKKDQRGNGFATKLIDYLSNHAHQTHVDAIELFVLESNETAQRLYKKLGFRTEKRLMRREVLSGHQRKE